MDVEHDDLSQQSALDRDTLLREQKRADCESNRMQWIAVGCSAIGIIVLFAGAMAFDRWNRHRALAAMLCLFSGCSVCAFPIGVVSERLAQRYFCGTTIPILRMAVVFVLIADITLVGWVLILMDIGPFIP